MHIHRRELRSWCMVHTGQWVSLMFGVLGLHACGTACILLHACLRDLLPGQECNSYYYWHYSRAFVTGFDVFQGIIKSVLFGGAIAIISCHRGFHSGAGAEGVGRAATEAFVFSFVTILVIDFLLGTFLMEAYFLIYPRTYSMG